MCVCYCVCEYVWLSVCVCVSIHNRRKNHLQTIKIGPTTLDALLGGIERMRQILESNSFITGQTVCMCVCVCLPKVCVCVCECVCLCVSVTVCAYMCG